MLTEAKLRASRLVSMTVLTGQWLQFTERPEVSLLTREPLINTDEFGLAAGAQEVCVVFWFDPSPSEETVAGGPAAPSEGGPRTSAWFCWESAALAASPSSFSSVPSSELASSGTNRFFMESATASLSSSSDSSKFLMRDRKLR